MLQQHLPQLGPDRPAQRAMVALSVLVSLLLLLADRAMEGHATWFEARTLRTLWFTLAACPPLLFGLVVQRLRDQRLLAGLLGYTLLIGGMAWYTGQALSPGVIEKGAVLLPYALVLLATLPIIAAHFAVWLLRDDMRYGLLFEASWRQISAALQALAYTGVFWLLLKLWGALFRAIDIAFFAELFLQDHFAYPATGLVFGLGLVIARSSSALSDTLHLCILALWRGLLPMVCALALCFAATLPFTAVQPLWATRNATALLLTLIFVLVFFSNAAFAKGEEPLPSLWRRRLHEAALLVLPLFAGLAGWALALRIGQHGVSLDRLWAGFATTIAGLYALGYTAAVLRPQRGWLGLVAPVNRCVAIFAATAALATQTGLMDFRAITAHALRERAATLNDADLVYLRWELGATGVRALQAVQLLRPSPFGAELLAASEQNKRFKHDRDARERMWGLANRSKPAPQRALGTPEPRPAWLTSMRESLGHDSASSTDDWLLTAELTGEPPPEWVWLQITVPKGAACENLRASLFEECAEGLCFRGEQSHCFDRAELQKLLDALRGGSYTVQPPAVSDLNLGGAVLNLSRIQP